MQFLLTIASLLKKRTIERGEAVLLFRHKTPNDVPEGMDWVTLDRHGVLDPRDAHKAAERAYETRNEEVGRALRPPVDDTVVN